MQLDMSVFSSKQMINLDSEDDDTVTVSCAGGSDVRATLPFERVAVCGTVVTVAVKGLKGGHSGVEIHKGRVNADKLMGQALSELQRETAFSVIDINGGDKANAIPKACVARLCAADGEAVAEAARAVLSRLRESLVSREAGMVIDVTVGESGEQAVLPPDAQTRLIELLADIPDGVQAMSADIAGLVETSLNLGVLQTMQNGVMMHFALRSNKQRDLMQLEDEVCAQLSRFACDVDRFGHYPPWEYKADSTLRRVYEACYEAQNGVAPNVEAIHAGLECGVFAKGIEGLDCIAIGPTLADVHTTDERMSISSVKRTYELLLTVLRSLC